MTESEYLISKLGEECSEVAQMTSKINCFGLDDVYDNVDKNPKSYNNRERLVGEINDLFAVIELLQDAGHLPFTIRDSQQVRDKKVKLGRYMDQSRKLGCLK